MSRVERAAGLIRRFGGGGTRRLSLSAEVLADHGRGCYLYGEAGERYLDVVSGFGVASLGHCHPHWVEAVVGQAQRLVVSPLYTDEVADYLAALADVLPSSLEQTALFSGGAEAVEVAIRLAQGATGRSGILTFGQSFHGKTLALRYSGDATSREARALSPGWLRTLPYPLCDCHDVVSYSECDASVADVLAEIRAEDDVAAILVEPVLGTAGNLAPRRRFLPELRTLCDERGWLLMLDEMITGFGRTGRMFAAETFDVRPDVLMLGKGMGGGFPMSAVCTSADLWERSALDQPSATATSYGGNPLAAAAGRATLEILRAPGFLNSVRRIGDLMARRLGELADESTRVRHARGIGLLLGFDLIDSTTGAPMSREECLAVCRACRDRGVLLAADVDRVRLNPPLIFTAADVERLFAVLHEVLV